MNDGVKDSSPRSTMFDRILARAHKTTKLAAVLLVFLTAGLAVFTPYVSLTAERLVALGILLVAAFFDEVKELRIGPVSMKREVEEIKKKVDQISTAITVAQTQQMTTHYSMTPEQVQALLKPVSEATAKAKRLETESKAAQASASDMAQQVNVLKEKISALEGVNKALHAYATEMEFAYLDRSLSERPRYFLHWLVERGGASVGEIVEDRPWISSTLAETRTRLLSHQLIEMRGERCFATDKAKSFLIFIRFQPSPLAALLDVGPPPGR